MLIGVPKEIKVLEGRVGLIPASVKELIDAGHEVFVQKGAGKESFFSDSDYLEVGAVLCDNAEEIFAKSEMIVKVKEPQPQEYKLLREGQILFTYLHLAPDLEQTKALVESGCIAIAYETVTDYHGGLPLLSPMSEVAGRLSVQVGAHCLERPQGGRGVLLGGVPGVRRGDVVVIGGGVVGTNAIRMAMGRDANVTVLDKSLKRLRELDHSYGSKLNTVYSTRQALAEHVAQADLVVGAVLVPGSTAPKLVTRELLKSMRPGSVIVDVAIDQGGCFETSRPTSHTEPTYVEDEVVHYCVTNMPGAVPRTSSAALNNATLPFAINLANLGYKEALLSDPHLMNGLNVHRGKIAYKAIAENLGFEYTAPRDLIS